MQRSFISSQNYKALDALCDAFVKLVIVHREHYPALPFLPWQHGSLPIEKFFAISRKFFPNFTFAEFVGVIRHVLLRETALLNLARQEQLTPDELKTYRVRVTRSQIAEAADLAWDEVLALLQEPLHFVKLPTLPLIYNNDAKSRRTQVAGYTKGDDSGDESQESDDDGLADEREALRTITDSEHSELGSTLPDDIRQSTDLFYASRLSSLMKDVENEESVVARQESDSDPTSRTVIQPQLANLLNEDPIPDRLEDILRVTAIIRKDKTLDVSAVVRLRSIRKLSGC
ncbi:hypothetical protein EW026_g7710 [Hermanssonia centrifuga]|uniref:Uncharacterized protein n=1 Tax=Hermanssonia centrifuga TaxID=98765 RepID=A0A4S4K6V8_9APHY|nr:hypothetical protein EW026_g7710 [Hermanssonia centrifuga]